MANLPSSQLLLPLLHWPQSRRFVSILHGFALGYTPGKCQMKTKTQVFPTDHRSCPNLLRLPGCLKKVTSHLGRAGKPKGPTCFFLRPTGQRVPQTQNSYPRVDLNVDHHSWSHSWGKQLLTSRVRATTLSICHSALSTNPR